MAKNCIFSCSILEGLKEPRRRGEGSHPSCSGPRGSLVARAPAPWTRSVKESVKARNLGPRIPTAVPTEVSSPPEAPRGPRCTGRLLSRSQSLSPLCPGPQSHILPLLLGPPGIVSVGPGLRPSGSHCLPSREKSGVTGRGRGRKSTFQQIIPSHE